MNDLFSGSTMLACRELSCYAEKHCPLYENAGFIDLVLRVFANFPFYFTIYLTFVFVYKSLRDLYYPIAITLGSFISWIINIVISAAVSQESPHYPCGQRLGMPSDAVQQAFFFATIVAWAPVSIDKHMTAFQYRVLTSVPAFVVTASVAYGYATPLQCFVGGLVGFAFGTLWHFITIWLLKTQAMLLISRVPVIKYLGFTHTCIESAYGNAESKM